jgi:hypothetical protein
MKKILLSCVLLAIAVVRPLIAQTCIGVTLKEGGGYEMANYDAKGKLLGTSVYKVKKVGEGDGGTTIEMDFQSLDAKGRSEMGSTYTLKCKGDQLFVDAKSLLGPKQEKSFGDTEMTFTAKDLVYPMKYKIGETLPDGSLNGSGTSGPLTIVMDIKIKERKVVAQEKITTPAGTFDSYKVTSLMNMTSKTFMNVSFDFDVVSYRSPGVLWDVKSETYQKGKLVGRSELTKVF